MKKLEQGFEIIGTSVDVGTAVVDRLNAEGKRVMQLVHFGPNVWAFWEKTGSAENSEASA